MRQVAALITTGAYGGDTRLLSHPHFTMTTQNNFGIAGMPTMIDEHNKNGKSRGLDEFVSTVLAGGNHHGLVGVPFITICRGKSMSREITQPLSTQTSMINHGILSTEAVNAFFSYYYGKAQSSGINDPIKTISTRDRVALVLNTPGNIEVEDCTYRMIQPHEVQRAMAFDGDYIVLGSGKDKVRQLGNAVTPPVMEWLLEKGIETFN